MTTAPRSVLPARALALTSAALLGAGLLAGCGGGSDAATSTTSPAAATATGASSSAASAGLTVVDPYVKTAPSGMTALFGILKNDSASDITLVSGSSPAAKMVELHEVAMVDGAMKMRPKAGGFVIPANGSHELKPGGDHIMLMGLTGPITAGQTVTATLTTQDGATITVTALAKDIAAGNETYAPSGAAGMSPGMSMGGASASPSASS